MEDTLYRWPDWKVLKTSHDFHGNGYVASGGSAVLHVASPVRMYSIEFVGVELTRFDGSSLNWQYMQRKPSSTQCSTSTTTRQGTQGLP